ncbi:EAL domain-containing protein [Roseibium denhamense]|uniref:Diguanylate cyclase (GGDEF) domain-containing protein n=1 Tax=Roseibium denhamense TaxID=76305 RepID=A0ABY1N5I4_9HYPH|nr:GGDEF domain-containing phosphodiesterase [Roseibium denhamense]MTI04389.1 EAL domain-containing protein [Roseibium denhamense]SMP00662.1 diguanylate cyclase (GGDEF) domain-containing protein [Roseibium denhamense]
MVLGTIGLVSGLGYYELTTATTENAKIRIDRAARTAAALMRYGADDALKPVLNEDGQPLLLTLQDDADERTLTHSGALDDLLATIGRANQGAANMFRWSEQDQAFNRFASTFRAPDGGPPPPFSISSGHPAFESLSNGQRYIGNVPVQGRMRLAYIMPIMTGADTLKGALAVDVGWIDDLSTAKNRHKARLLLAAAIIVVFASLVGILLLRTEFKPLVSLAETADQLAGGRLAGRVPFTHRHDEIGHLAQGLVKVTELQDKLHKLAYTDPVTMAGNRTRYFSELNAALKETRTSSRCFSLIHLDFSGFAKINDTFGQQVGNRVLLQAYARLVRTFGRNAKISRISADDFCILLPCDEEGTLAEDRAIQALEMLSVPFQLEEGEIRVDPCIGIALLPQDADDAETAHRIAGLALRAAKSKDVNSYEFFSAPMNEKVQSDMLLETLLRAAIRTKQLELHYQPQFRPQDGRLIGLEALIRWPSEKGGYIPPSNFIPIAEKTGLVLDVGHFVLEEACRQIAIWRAEGFDFNQVSVNVSPIQFRQSSFAEQVREILSFHGVPANSLCLEVTENVFVDTSEQRVLDILSELQDIGVQLSLDDFGSGYSSLSYLHRLPFQELKIDRAFLTDADSKVSKSELFKAIVDLGKGLGLRVIAEGAETDGEYGLTSSLGCDGVQGYFCCPPVPVGELRNRLHAFSQTQVRASAKRRSA